MKTFLVLKQALCVFAFLGLAACETKVGVTTAGGPDEQGQSSYRGEPAAGLINGQSWIFLSGAAKADFVDPSHMSLNFYDQKFEDPCFAFSSGAKVLTSVKAVVGETRFGQQPDIYTATFSYSNPDGSGANMIAFEGSLTVVEITAETVSGFIIAQYDGANYINGSFKMKVCPR